MANILTAAEAANALRCAADDPNMLDLLPLVDDALLGATGRDWTKDTPVHAKAKSAARMLLVRWHEDPGGMAAGGALGFGLQSVLVQLQALALQLESDGAPDEPLALVKTNITGEMDPGASLVLIFNHELTAGAVNQVSLLDPAGEPVDTSNLLDATGKILIVRPAESLTAGAAYTIVLDHPADAYGQTVDTELSFSTAD